MSRDGTGDWIDRDRGLAHSGADRSLESEPCGHDTGRSKLDHGFPRFREALSSLEDALSHDPVA